MKKIISVCVATLAICVALAQKPEKYDYGVFYYQRASLFDALGVDSTDIVMLGNSLTNGCEWHELLDMPNVKNRGISSDVIQGVSDRLPSLIKGHPAKIFLLIGVNDVSHNLGVDSIVEAYGKLIDKIRMELPDTKLYVQSMLPVNISFGKYLGMADKGQQIEEINERIKLTAREKGFTWVDLYDIMADEEGHLRREYTNDGLHLLAPGYLAWAEAIMPYIKE